MILSSKTYDILKYIALIGLPAIATFWSIIAPVWGLAYSNEVLTTLIAGDTLLGALLGISSAQFKASKSE